MPKTGKAERVRRKVLSLLARGEHLQNALINETARGLPEIESSTINILVRKLLQREKGRLANLREEKSPYRKFWSLTPTGVFVGYELGTITLQEFALGLVQMKPKGCKPFTDFLSALASSQKLSSRVGIFLAGDLRLLEGMVSWLGEDFKVKISTTVFYSVAFPLIRNSAYILEYFEDAREEAGNAVVVKICRLLEACIDQAKEELDTALKSLRKLNALERSHA